MNSDRIAEQIRKYGELYRDEHFEKYNKVLLKKDPLNALDFFFGRVFYGGISDDICTRERNISFSYIKKLGFVNTINKIQNQNFMSQIRFVSILKKKGVSNQRRGKMVYCILEWLSNIPENNCIIYSINIIKKGKISLLFHYLVDEIYFIGPKKAALYLRDLIDLFDLQNYLKYDEFIYVLPIDTYINRFLIDMKLKNVIDIKWEEDAKIILNWCKRAGISPISFDQGVWYAYANNLVLVD